MSRRQLLAAGAAAAVATTVTPATRAALPAPSPVGDDVAVAQSDDRCLWVQVRGSSLDRDASDIDPGFGFDAVTTALGGQFALGEGCHRGEASPPVGRLQPLGRTTRCRRCCGRPGPSRGG